MYKPYNLNFFEANFREFLIIEKVAPVTLKNYLSDLRHFLGWLPIYWKTNNDSVTLKQVYTEKIPNQVWDVIRSVQHDTIKNYCSYLSQNQTPIKTINRRLSTLRRFFSFCISQGWTTQNPAKHIANIPSPRIQDKSCDNGLILKTEVIEQPQHSIKNIVAEYKTYLIKNKVVEKEISLIVSDIDEFITITNFSQRGNQL